jgi:VCBS repeat protein
MTASKGSNNASQLRAMARVALILLACLFSTQAAAFVSAPYFPLPDGATWTYHVSDGTTETRTVAGTKSFNGAQVKILRDQAGTENYFTNDDAGVRFHGGVFVDPVNGNETDTYSPPVPFAARDSSIGTQVSGSGTATGVQGSTTITLSYTSGSTPLAIETVTVPAGTFANAVHVRLTINYSGFFNGIPVNYSATLDDWLVAGVGSVREVAANTATGTTTTYELQSYNVPDLIPDAFAFPPKTVQAPGVAVVSDAITVSGISAPTSISIVGGDYQINGGAFRSDAASVINGDQVAVRVLSPQPGFSASATLNIGGVTAAFTVTTATDTTPNPFSFTPITGAPLGIVLTSTAITVGGINTPAPISVSGGEYAVSGGAFTSAPGTVCNGCRVEVRVASAASYGVTTSATLTIGGVSAVFSVTTLVPGEGPLWELFYASQTGDYIGAGRTRLIPFGPAHPEATFDATLNASTNAVTFHIAAGTDEFYLYLDAPGNRTLTPGRYEAAVRYPFNGSGPGLDFDGNGRGCSTLTGRFDILDIGYDASGNVQRLAARFEQHCEGAVPALFGEVRINSTVPLGSNAIRRTLADVSGDAHSDVLWRNTLTGENYLYPMNGTSILAGEGYLRTVADLNWKVAGIGDFDGDGRADILWRNTSTGQNYIYFMDGTTIKPTEGLIRTVPLAWTVAGIGDFDGDGKDDILWRNSVTGENYLYPMDGRSIKATEGYVRTVADQSWRIAGIGDFDGDGKADVLWRHAASGQNYIYFMDGITIKPSEGFIRTVADLNWQVKGIGDFDGDGKADIVWRNSASGQNYLYLMDGRVIKPTEGSLRTIADLNWQIVAVGDYDGDGKSDLLWRNSSTGENYIYPMDGTTIKPTERLTRTVGDQRWQVLRP